MRFTETLLAAVVVLLASTDSLAAASKATKNGLYADFYRVEDGAVTEKMRVPLGDVDQYKESDFKQFKKAVSNQEERAAARLPRGFDKMLGGFEKFVGMFRWRSHRRLRIEDA